MKYHSSYCIDTDWFAMTNSGFYALCPSSKKVISDKIYQDNVSSIAEVGSSEKSWADAAQIA